MVTSITIMLAKERFDLPFFGQGIREIPERPYHTQEIIDQLSNVIINGSGELKFTTYSEDCINFIGLLIHEKLIDPKIIEIQMFKKGKIERLCYFNNEGIVSDNWPYGWFQYNLTVSVESFKTRMIK